MGNYERARGIDVTPEILTLPHRNCESIREVPTAVEVPVDGNPPSSIDIPAVAHRYFKETIVKLRAIVTVRLQLGWNDDVSLGIDVPRLTVLDEPI